MDNPLSKFFKSFSKKEKKPEPSDPTYDPELAKLLEKESHTAGSSALSPLAAAYNSKTPTIEELQTIEKGFDIVCDTKCDATQSKALWEKEGSKIMLLAGIAGEQLETKYGVASRTSKKYAQRLMEEDQTNDPDKTPCMGKLTTLINAINKAPETVEIGTKETIIKAQRTIDEIAYGGFPTQNDLEALRDLKDCIKEIEEEISDQELTDDPDKKTILDTASSIFSDKDTVNDLSVLQHNAVKNMLSLHEKYKNTNNDPKQDKTAPLTPI